VVHFNVFSFNSELLNSVVSTIIPGDETWYFQYDSENREQSMLCKTPASPRHIKTFVMKPCMKTVLITLFSIRGVAHFEFILQG